MAPDHRYAQFCPSARAVEILGERWTLLIARELLCGPQRFTDLRRRLPGIGPSILTERLARLEERGIVARRDVPPPAPAVLYSLTEVGEELRSVLHALIRFGMHFVEAPEPGDHLEPEWMRLALEAFSRRTPTPSRRFLVRIPDGSGDVAMLVSGGRRGTTVRDVVGSPDADAEIRIDAVPLVALAGGRLPADAAVAAGRLEVKGDTTALDDFPSLFDLADFLARPEPTPTGRRTSATPKERS